MTINHHDKRVGIQFCIKNIHTVQPVSILHHRNVLSMHIAHIIHIQHIEMSECMHMCLLTHGRVHKEEISCIDECKHRCM